MGIFMMFIPPTQDQGISSNMLRSAWVSFTSIVTFSSYKFHTAHVHFIPKKVIFSDAILNGISLLLLPLAIDFTYESWSFLYINFMFYLTECFYCFN